jgi:hypothetical protein
LKSESHHYLCRTGRVVAAVSNLIEAIRVIVLHTRVSAVGTPPFGARARALLTTIPNSILLTTMVVGLDSNTTDGWHLFVLMSPRDTTVGRPFLTIRARYLIPRHRNPPTTFRHHGGAFFRPRPRLRSHPVMAVNTNRLETLHLPFILVFSTRRIRTLVTTYANS